MQNVKVKVSDLLVKVQENRAKHEQEYKEAVIGWKSEVKTKLTKALENLDNGGKVESRFSIIEPVEHLKDYDRAIEMLRMTVDIEVVLEAHEFDQLCLDSWAWKEQFTGTNMLYSNK